MKRGESEQVASRVEALFWNVLTFEAFTERQRHSPAVLCKVFFFFKFEPGGYEEYVVGIVKPL